MASPTSSSFPLLLRSVPKVLVAGAVGCVLAVGLSLLQPLEYRSTTKVLVIPKISGVDPYTASRSAETVADQLASMLATSSIYNAVLSQSSVDRAYFPQNIIQFQNAWSDAVTASVTRGSGILTINAYHTNPKKAEALAEAVAHVYVADGWKYVTGEITMQVIDEAVNSRYPVRPNILVNGVTGLFLGFFGGGGYVVISHERRRRAHRVI